MSKLRRVVVTGMGVVSPLGCGLKYSWNKLMSGGCGISKLPADLYGKLPCQVAALIPRGNGPGELDLMDHFTKSDLRMMAPATTYAIVAAHEALADANWFPEDLHSKELTGVAVGVGMIDFEDVCKTNEILNRGYNRVSPYFIPRILPNMAAGQISMKYGFCGPNHAVSTACATGVHAIGDAFRFIRYGGADVMVCGAAEAGISPLAIASFCRLRALSTEFNDRPEAASRPFDRDRNGFVMGEGAGILVLEELNHAKSRQVNIYAELLGYGLSGDASHLTSPSEDGRGATLAMMRSLNEANLLPKDIGYINAHATSTPIGDSIESKAIGRVFNEYCPNIAVSSTKGAHGHLLGAAGNLESIFTVMACYSSALPPTINLENVGEDINMNLCYVTNTMQEWKKLSYNNRRVALKNAFGFGGTNACICIAEYVD